MNILFVYFNKDYRPRTLLSLNVLETIIKQTYNTCIFDTSFYTESLSFGAGTKDQVKSGIHKSIKNLKIPIKTSSLYGDFINKIKSFNPKIIAFTFYSLNSDIQRELLTPIKKMFPDIKILAGGPQPSINPHRCLEEEAYIDYVCCGEGEVFLKEFCDKVRDNKNILDIKGLWYRDRNGKIISNGVAQKTDLATLPSQNLDSWDPIQMFGLFDGKAYRMGHVEFTRGCPYDCSYCGAGSIRRLYENTGGYVRSRDPKLAVAEYKVLKEKYNLDMFYFIDGTFLAMPHKTFEELATLYKKEVNLPFIALVHPNTIKEKNVKLLKEMGCVHVSMGVESGIAEYRASVLNRKMSNEQIVKSVHLLRQYDIHVAAYNIIGMPGMDRSHVFETIELNRRARVHSSIVSIFIPYLDNDMTKKLIQDGLLDPKKIVVKNGVEPTVEISDMEQKEITAIYNTFNLYLKLPKFLYPVIKLLERNNGICNLIRKLLYKVIDLVSHKAKIK